MVIIPQCRRRRAAMLTADMVVGLGLLVIALLPVSYSFYQESLQLRSFQAEAVAMAIVDGEMEVLAAGQWRAHPAGTHPYAVQAASATNLPPGNFTLTVNPSGLRLEWKAAQKRHGRPVVREVTWK